MNASEQPGNPNWHEPAIAGAPAIRSERSGSVDFCAEATRRLQTVSEKLGQFVQEQIKRLESATRQCEDILAQRSSVQQMQQQLQREQTDWSEQQNQQQEEIRIEQDRLIHGWQSLEDEQRRLIVQNSSATPTAIPAGQATPPVTSSPVVVTPDRTVFADQNVQQPPSAVAMSRESALDQFQRLKREIRNHTQRAQQGPYHNGNH